MMPSDGSSSSSRNAALEHRIEALRNASATYHACLSSLEALTLTRSSYGPVPYPTHDPIAARLTPAHRRVLALLGEGLVPKEIAGRLGRSVYTVRNQVARIREIFGGATAARAIELARARGYIAPINVDGT